MRDIKFRAWDTMLCEMFEVYTLSKYEVYAIQKDTEDMYKLNLRDCEIMQYTGLKDKNGVWIYEGDIVIHKGEYLSLKKPAFVIFENGRFVMDCGDSVTHRLYKWSDNWSIEVIGNIYENKELLEEIK